VTALPNAFVFMKVGNHANETWDAILSRKHLEFESDGRIYWGYGGNTCHPTKHVQPFAEKAVQHSGRILLVMEPIDSRAAPIIEPATQYSVDGQEWHDLPKGAIVTGSKFALVLGEIQAGELDIPLNEYDVGVGPSRGNPAEDYVKGRTDKACLMRSGSPRTNEPNNESTRHTRYYAELIPPYAVFVQ